MADNGDVIKVNRGLYVKKSNTGENGPNDFHGIVRETSLEEFLNGAENFSVYNFPETLQNITMNKNSGKLFNFIFYST